MGGLEEIGQGGNEEGCLCIARKGPDRGRVQCLSSQRGKRHLPDDPLCGLVLTAVQCRLQSAGMGFNTDFCCLGWDCLSFTHCSLHCQFG